MKTAIYPGSFNKWHRGHDDVLRKALHIFSKVIIALGKNPEKNILADIEELKNIHHFGIVNGTVEVVQFNGLLVDYIKKVNENERIISAVIRGLRNAKDFEEEKMMQYYNEDLAIGIPTLFVIANRNLVHKSSSAERAIEKFRSGK